MDERTAFSVYVVFVLARAYWLWGLASATARLGLCRFAEGGSDDED